MSERFFVVAMSALALIIVGMIATVGFVIWDNSVHTSTASNCTVTDGRTYYNKGRHFRLATSCGTFSTNRSTYREVEIGGTYDFTVHGTFAPTITL